MNTPIVSLWGQVDPDPDERRYQINTTVIQKTWYYLVCLCKAISFFWQVTWTDIVFSFIWQASQLLISMKQSALP